MQAVKSCQLTDPELGPLWGKALQDAQAALDRLDRSGRPAVFGALHWLGRTLRITQRLCAAMGTANLDQAGRAVKVHESEGGRYPSAI